MRRTVRQTPYLTLVGMVVILVLWNAMVPVRSPARTFQELPAPTLVGPPDGALVDSMAPLLRWENPPNTTQYHLQVTPANNDGPGIDLVRNVEVAFQVEAPRFRESNYVLLPGMTYTWRVRATAATTAVGPEDPNWGPWASSTFRTSGLASWTAAPVHPPDGGAVASLTPTLRWGDDDDRIFYYEVQVSKDPTFNTDPATATAMVYWVLLHGGVTTPPDSYAIPAEFPLEPNIRYYWRVRPRVQGDGSPVEWPGAWSFRTVIPPSAPPAPAPSEPGPQESKVTISLRPAIEKLVEPAGPGEKKVTYTLRNNVGHDIPRFSLALTVEAGTGAVRPVSATTNQPSLFEVHQNGVPQVLLCVFALREGQVLRDGQSATFACAYREDPGTLVVDSENISPPPSEDDDANYNQVSDALEETIRQRLAEGRGAEPLSLVLQLTGVAGQPDLDLFSTHGGKIDFVGSEMPFLGGEMPAIRILGYSGAAWRRSGFVALDAPVDLKLDVATRNSRASKVWTGALGGDNRVDPRYAFVGDPNTSIAIVDTGIDGTHQAFGGFQDVAKVGWDNLANNTRIVGWHDATGIASTPTDTDGHGSHVAGIAAGSGSGTLPTGVASNQLLRGVAHGARLVGVRTGEGSFDQFLKWAIHSLDWVVKNRNVYRVVVLNQSQGDNPPKPPTPSWIEAANRVVRAGIVMTVAVGNEFDDGTGELADSPSEASQVISVSSANDGEHVRYSSNNGRAVGPGTPTLKPDVVAPGAGILSVGTNSGKAAPDHGRYVEKSGTSMAAPHVAGEAGLIIDAMTDYAKTDADGDGKTDEDPWDGKDNDGDGLIDEDAGPWGYQHSAAKLVKAIILMSTYEVPGGETVPTDDMWFDENNNKLRDDKDEVIWDRNNNGIYDAGDVVLRKGANGVTDTPMGTVFRNGDADTLHDLWYPNAGASNDPRTAATIPARPKDAAGNPVPVYDRGGKDNKEGYGHIAIDAAIEAVTKEFCAVESDQFGANPGDKKVWARHLHLYQGKNYRAILEVPANADYDLYLYQGVPDAYGEPVIARRPNDVGGAKGSLIKSTGAETADAANDEGMTFQVPADGLYFLVARRIAGSGAFTVRLVTPEEWTVMVYMPAELEGGDSLDDRAFQALNSMEGAGSGEAAGKDIQVLALVDYDQRAYDDDPAHAGDAVLYCIRKDHIPTRMQYSHTKTAG